jgi:predicted lysophospholipase L1 biosynthesis ABC-type transport system permease subunit
MAVPAVATPAALAGLKLAVGDETQMSLGRGTVPVRLVGTVDAVPGTTEPAALLVDLPSLAAVDFHQSGATRWPTEHWLATAPGREVAAAAAAHEVAGIEVLDRRDAAAVAGKEAYGAGARVALFVAAIGAILLALVGLLVDVRATARRRVTELAVLNTLGAGSRLLARTLVVEQLFLAGVGVLVGLVVGIGVAATMAPLVILTPAAATPVPPPDLAVPWLPVLGTAIGLLVVAPAVSALVASGLRQRLVAARLRMGADS